MQHSHYIVRKESYSHDLGYEVRDSLSLAVPCEVQLTQLVSDQANTRYQAIDLSRLHHYSGISIARTHSVTTNPS